MSLLLVSFHISLRIILCLNYNQPIVNFIPLKLLSCMNKMIFSLHLMLIIVQPFCSWSVGCFFIDPSILTHRLQHWFGISFTALNLLGLSCGLSDRSQTVITSASKSQPGLLEYGVPQGRVWGLLLYSLHTIPLHFIISKYPGFLCHFYADDTQKYYLFISPELTSAFSSIESCIKDVFSWMIGNKLCKSW